METTQGISLYGCLHFNLAKHHVFLFFIFYVFFSTKSQNKRVEQVLAVGGGWVQIMCTHVSKYKNDKMKLNINK
jgi:hypothetical protein